MARVTVEDCIEHVPNRFELVALAAQRARQIVSGAPINVERDNDKDTVVSLREIAEEKISLDNLRSEVIISHQKFGKKDIIDDSNLAIPAIASEVQQELTSLEDDGSADLDADMAFDDDVTDED